MAEITRVPLPPISKGSVFTLFLGIVIGLAIAGAVAWLNMPKGLTVTEISAGSGEKPTLEDVVFVKYVGKLADGTEFDRSQPMPFPTGGLLPEGTPMLLDGVVPGFRDGLLQMEKGGKYELFIPADQAYGASPPPGAPIPPNSDLTFEVEVIDIMPRAEVEQRFQKLQAQMMQQAPEAEGAPAPPPAE